MAAQREHANGPKKLNVVFHGSFLYHVTDKGIEVLTADSADSADSKDSKDTKHSTHSNGHRCRQCDGTPDGTEQEYIVNGERLWLHDQCESYWRAGDGWGQRR